MATVEQAVQPLAMGDTLTRAEFLRRWEAQPEIKRAELIRGVVYMASPVSIQHADAESPLGAWATVYMAATPGCIASHHATVLLAENCLQPDVHLRLLPEYGGVGRIEDHFIRGPLELMMEVCRSSTAYDLHQKLELYQEAGVREYLAILLTEQEVRWHVLVGGTYQRLPPDADGIWRSRVFPGLWLDGPALLQRDVARVLARLHEGLASPEHQAFVAELAARRNRQPTQ